MGKVHKILPFLFLILFIFISSTLNHNYNGTGYQNTSEPQDVYLKPLEVITLDQVLVHPNLTYELYPIYNDRYFGSEIFNLTIQKISGAALDIIVPIGQILMSNTTDIQNMTIAKQEVINLTAGADSQSLNLTVFCINVQGDVPQPIHNYLISAENATGDLAKFLIYIDNNSLYNLHYTQLAVWAASDGPDQIPSGYIYNNTEVSWANALLAAAETSLVIPDMPTIPGFPIWALMLSIGFLFILYRITKWGRQLG